jgi:hypothetical protein
MSLDPASWGSWSWVIIPLSYGWIALWIGASIVYRRGKGKPIFPRAPADAVFVTRAGSGRSLKNLITRIGGARNCLLIAVTPTDLEVTPWFPFNLMFLPEIYGLECRVPLADLSAVRRESRLFARIAVIEFNDPSGRPCAVELRCSALDEFVQALTTQKASPRSILQSEPP